MSSAGPISEIRRQYEELPYPPRDPEDEHRRLLGSWHDSLALINHYCFAGRRDFRGGFRALVAGGGTGDAAIFLAEELEAVGGEVVYLDISAASMSIAYARAEERSLQNILWKQGSLLDLPRLGLGPFDYINCCGVLHHLQNPELGLNSLKAALKPDGAMQLMVYGKYGRAAIYPLQDLLRMLLGENQGLPNRVDVARRVLRELPASNWFNHCKSAFAGDLASDAGTFDLLLHSQDRGYSVPELYQFVEASGLRIGCLMSPCRAAYLPATYVADRELLSAFARLALPEQQSACELLAGNLLRHFLYCGLDQPEVAAVDDLENVPFMHPQHDHTLGEAMRAKPAQPITLGTAHGFEISVRPQRYSADIFQHLDGTRSLREIFELVRRNHAPPGDLVANTLPDAVLMADFVPLYEQLNSVDLLLLRHASVPPFPTLAELQAQMGRRAPS